jgi:hypothetical protein
MTGPARGAYNGRVSRFYANITVRGPAQADVVAYLKRQGVVAYVSPTVKAATVVYHADMGTQEDVASALSAHFQCPALLVMNYGDAVLLYHLYVNGEQADAYVSSPHDDLETGGQPVPEGDAGVLCDAFEAGGHRAAGVGRVLRRPTHPTKGYALAVNRHGELARALGLPLFAAGTGFRDIEVGELPHGQGFDPDQLVRTGG